MRHKIFYNCTLLLLFLLSFTHQVKAQEESILYFMNDLPQRQHQNPAHKSVYKTSIVLPSMYVNNNSIILPFDVIINGDEFPGSFDLGKIINELNQLEQDEDHATLEIAGLYISNDKISLSFFAREKANFLSYNEELAIPSTFGVSDANETKTLDINHYREYGLGFNYNIKDRLTIGFNAKYLSGLDQVKINGAELDSANQNINSGLVAFESGKNGHGYSVDLGISYQITDRWLVDIAATNLGQIYWNEAYQYAEIGDLYPTPSTDDSSIESKDPYTTNLPMQFVLGGSYDFGHRFLIGATVGGGYYKDIFNPKFSINMHKRFADFLGLGINYSREGTGLERVGASASIGFPGIKAYAITENVFGVIDQWDSDRSLMVRIGVNLNFGYVKKNYLNKKETRSSKIMEAEW
ncbi:hypothetical protein KMW28_08950 [Flammeovirga yaeyamensis]|uniref:DUF5723 domain-containing protein n=1 Tax=Flammeovirga yaeyamensis TaxID=367791 RepID=A0AAX1N971_9BACT|nr:DUF5723 family protein [Flammeovirga yaeyamensis]MBB3698908.1 hypothetical protein [Flammeovirga yaeyamensis]NMF36343.1 hypothetical protein [Flammeovirga yaeyamensis]QWG03696.1 hypothetical protein KMW28_08950 [Flammeovirga yaeyamensis]